MLIAPAAFPHMIRLTAPQISSSMVGRGLAPAAFHHISRPIISADLSVKYYSIPHKRKIVNPKNTSAAKQNGKKYFDFWGIAPEGAPANHPWVGFTNFKKTFAGQEIDYAGTYDIILNPTKYRLYQLTRKLNRLLRRV